MAFIPSQLQSRYDLCQPVQLLAPSSVKPFDPLAGFQPPAVAIGVYDHKDKYDKAPDKQNDDNRPVVPQIAYEN